MFKRTIIASAVLLATSSVWAASTGNQATVTQAQVGNTATIYQVVASIDNKAGIDQDGNANMAAHHPEKYGPVTGCIPGRRVTTTQGCHLATREHQPLQSRHRYER